MYPATFLYKNGRFREVKIVKKRQSDWLSPQDRRMMLFNHHLKMLEILNELEREQELKNKDK